MILVIPLLSRFQLLLQEFNRVRRDHWVDWNEVVPFWKLQSRLLASRRNKDRPVWALRKIISKRSKSVAARVARLALDGCLSIDKEISVVNVIENHQPRFPAPAKPVVHQFEYISPRILPSWNLDYVCNISIGLLESSCVARVHPENPCIR